MRNRGRSLVACIFAILLFIVPSAALAFDVPSHDGAVTDVSGTLSAEDDTILEARIAGYRSRTGNEIGVLVIESLEGETIEDVAYRTFNTWGVGKKDLDNGVLVVLALKEHRSRIETGKGIGHLLTDVTASHILSDVLAPYMRRNEVRAGIMATLIAIESSLDQTTSSTTPVSPPSTYVAPPSDSTGTVFTVLMVGIVGFAGLMALSNRSRRRWNGSSYDSSWSSYDSSSHSSHSSYDGGGGGGYSGGGDSGGGGSFGGGGSDGGGSSGSW
jgi:uncharacterized protein